jgi:hypothetical protein
MRAEEISEVVVRFYTHEAEFLDEHPAEGTIGPAESHIFTRPVEMRTWTARSTSKFASLLVTTFTDDGGNVCRNETPPGSTMRA